MKYTQKSIISLALASIFIGCGETGVVDIDTKVERSYNPSSLNAIEESGISYLNDLRLAVGMIPFQRELHLEEASLNHANYLVTNNIFTHNELESNSGFTGITPSDRTHYAGYEHALVGENISSSNSSVEESIDVLFSAIYHRFGFLNFDYDELGIGFSQSETYDYGNIYNYNMGISPLRILCEGAGEVSGGAYYENICLDSSKQIAVSDFTFAYEENKLQNPTHVIWPTAGTSDVSPVFYEESPDPLPECSVSGYPVSISFNSLKSKAIMIDSFKLYDSNNQEITDVKLMDKTNDPNQHFTEHEFALFPMNRLDWDSAYHVEIVYHDNGELKREEVDFKTASLPYPYFNVDRGGETFEVGVNKTTLFYLPPAHCNDKLTTFSATGLVAEIAFYDANTLMITPMRTGKLEVTTSNGRNFTLDVR